MSVKEFEIGKHYQQEGTGTVIEITEIEKLEPFSRMAHNHYAPVPFFKIVEMGKRDDAEAVQKAMAEGLSFFLLPFEYCEWSEVARRQPGQRCVCDPKVLFDEGCQCGGFAEEQAVKEGR